MKGRVVDRKGRPLQIATVVGQFRREKGVLRGTVTGPGQNFVCVEVPNNKAVLEISFVGYVSPDNSGG